MEIEAVLDPSPLHEEVMVTDEAERQLRHCVGELDIDQRDAIYSAFFDGLTYVELAAWKGVPLGTMKSRVRRGLARLRERLRDE